MEATPDVYRADIAHTHAHIARIDSGDWQGETEAQAELRRWRLIGQCETLQRSLARAEDVAAHMSVEAGDLAWLNQICPECAKGLGWFAGRCLEEEAQRAEEWAR